MAGVADERALLSEAREKAARAELRTVLGRRKAVAGALRAAAVDALRALHCPPFLVVPHVYRPRAAPAPAPRDRFALLELE